MSFRWVGVGRRGRNFRPPSPTSVPSAFVHAIEHHRGSAEAHHHRADPPPGRLTIRVHHLDRPALVLGSTQPDELVDHTLAAAAGIEVTRRRSGGGLVPIEPGAMVWIDVHVPAGHARWRDDVGRAFDWVGEAWAAALDDLGVPTRRHRGRLETGPLGRLWCFAGLGPGELTADGVDGAPVKVLGQSQRRTREFTRLQTMAMTAPHPTWADGLLDPAAARTLTAGAAIDSTRFRAGLDLDATSLEARALERIAQAATSAGITGST